MGPEIYALQQKLNIFNYNLPLDGDFGVRTENAVLDFQERNGLKTTGKADEETLEFLDKSLGLPTTKEEKAEKQTETELPGRKEGLAKGNMGPNVYEIQKKLNWLGYNLPLDGDFGYLTEKAVKDFQRKNKITPTGVIDSITGELIDKLLKSL